jgi:hypothetical protein
MWYTHIVRHYAALKNVWNLKSLSSRQKTNTNWWHLHEVSRVVKLIETQSIMVITKGWGREKSREFYCLRNTEFPAHKLKNLWKSLSLSNVNITLLNYTFNIVKIVKILCCVFFATMKTIFFLIFEFSFFMGEAAQAGESSLWQKGAQGTKSFRGSWGQSARKSCVPQVQSSVMKWSPGEVLPPGDWRGSNDTGWQNC